jgi:hypothetical protein
MSIFDRFRRSDSGRLVVPGVPGRPTPAGRLVAGYSLDSGRALMPESVRRLPWRERQRWMAERGLVPAVGGGAGYGSTFLQMLEPFQVADAVTLSASVTETVISSDSLFTLSPNFFAAPGKQVWFRCMGKVSNVVTTPGTITFRLRYGGIAGTILANSGAIAFNSVAATDNMWYVETWLEALATGPSATALTLLTYGECWLANTAGAAADIRNSSMPPGGTALANVASLDGTTGKALSLTAQFSVSTAGTAITTRNGFIVALN